MPDPKAMTVANSIAGLVLILSSRHPGIAVMPPLTGAESRRPDHWVDSNSRRDVCSFHV